MWTVFDDLCVQSDQDVLFGFELQIRMMRRCMMQIFEFHYSAVTKNVNDMTRMSFCNKKYMALDG